jgi:hypothetical protein
MPYVTNVSGRSRSVLSICIATSIVAAGAALAVAPELRLAIPLLVGVTSLVVMLIAGVSYCGERLRFVWSTRTILVIALLLRLLFLYAPPQLSDDIYRYLWDGRSLLHGINPYAQAPASIQPPAELVDVHTRINHPEYVTIYPPAAQLVFAGGALLGGGITGLKTLLVLLDLVLCAIVIGILHRLEMPVWHAILYAWNPLPVLEIAGSGHVDGAGMTMVMGAIFLALAGDHSDGRQQMWCCTISGILIAGAGLVKLFPFALMPLLCLLIPSGQRRKYLIGFSATVLVWTGLFLPDLFNITSSLSAYARNWEFAGFAFSMLRRLTGSGDTARLLLIAAFLVVVGGIYLLTCFRIRQDSTLSLRVQTVLRGCYATAMAFLLLTPTLQPWYALSLAAFLPFCAGPAGLVLCWAVFLTYQVQIPYFILGQWLENPNVTAAVFLAPVTTWIISRCFHLRQGIEQNN